MTFDDFDLHPDILDGIDALNYTTPTPIQAQAIPIILEGRDLIGIAQTGTGKTAAFILPILSKILDSEPTNHIQTLVIVPTRELAQQIEKVVEAYTYFANVSCAAIYGGGDGKDFTREKNAIVSGAEILVSTPGRLLAHINLGYVDLSKLNYLVLDEADRMMDMGFQPDLLKIIGTVNKNRQTLLFSATMPPKVMKFASTLLRNPEKISIQLSKPAEGVDQRVYMLSEQQKPNLLYDLLKDRKGERIIVFCSSKLSVSALYRTMRQKKLEIEQISSDLEQAQREQVMLAFRNRKIDILVATDVLSRGIDVDGIDLVVNYDIPRDAEDYVHRVGRTARAGEKGEAFTFVTPHDLSKFRRIEQLIGKSLPKIDLMEAVPERDRNKKSAASPHKDRPQQQRSKQTKHKSQRPAEQQTTAPDPNAADGVAAAAKKKRRKKKKKKPVVNPVVS
jgi:ATP-dependent RNA helicase RhlE